MNLLVGFVCSPLAALCIWDARRALETSAGSQVVVFALFTLFHVASVIYVVL